MIHGSTIFDPSAHSFDISSDESIQLNETQKLNVKFNFILPKVKTYYIRQAQVLNIDNLNDNFTYEIFNENIK